MSRLARKLLPALLLIIALPAAAGQFGLALDAQWLSSWVWRGIELDRGATLQPGATVSWDPHDRFGLDLNAWWNLPRTSQGDPSHRDELYERDFTLSVRYVPRERWTLSAGGVRYTFPRASRLPSGKRPDTTEVFVAASHAGEVFSHTLQANYDVDLYRGLYLDWRSSATVPLATWLTLEASVHLGAAQGLSASSSRPDELAYYERNGLVDGALGAAFEIPLTERLSAKLLGAWVIRFDDDQAFDDRDRHTSWGGIMLAWTL